MAFVKTFVSEGALEFFLNNIILPDSWKVINKGNFYTFLSEDGEPVPLPNLLLNSSLLPGTKPPTSWSTVWNNLPGVTLIPDEDYPGAFLINVQDTGRDIIRQEVFLELGTYTCFIEYTRMVNSGGRPVQITSGGAGLSIIRGFRTTINAPQRDYAVIEINSAGLVRFEFGLGQSATATANYTMGRPMITPGLRSVNSEYAPT